MTESIDTSSASRGRHLRILLASPRGFCAGVERAVRIVEQALAVYGPPIYMRHEIVHNRAVVADLAAKGAVFVDELDDIACDVAPARVIFSAHGVAKSVRRSADRRNLQSIDATCPLVGKVHREAERRYRDGYVVVLIGHAGHPEVDGTLGQLPTGAIRLVESAAQAARLEVDAATKLACVMQTTLAVDETASIVAVLKRRFPDIAMPRHEDICYATTNRQAAVRDIAPHCDLVIVIGSQNSSNANRLTEVARRAGASDAILLDRVADLDWQRLDAVRSLGVTSGASTPESLVRDLVAACRRRFEVSVEEVAITTEDLHFKLPKPLVA